ncbi:MAG: glycosyltransferase family 4 protein [Verrucomicrobiota bacterium]
MKICLLVTRADAIGGASIHVRDLAAGLEGRGHTVVIFIGGTGPVTDLFDEANLSYWVIPSLAREVNPLKDCVAALQLFQKFRRFRPDLVACHTSKAGALGRIAAKALHIPVVYTPHCWSFAEGFSNARAYAMIERCLATLCDKVIVVSTYERDIALQWDAVPASRMEVIYNGVPDHSDRAEPGSNRPQMLMVGRFEEQKNQALLLRGLAPLRNLDWELEFVGDGPKLEMVKELCAELDLGDRVTFAGYQSNIPERLGGAQMFLLITNWESFPMSILEAMRAGLPVIASDVGGNRESVSDGKSGYVIDNENLAELTERLRALIGSSSLRAEMGKAGRSLYEENFSFEQMLDRTIGLYDLVLASHKGE